MQGKKDYSDIIDLPHPTSKKHPLMERAHRAIQFAPFAALTGHKEAVSETARITEQKVVLDDVRRLEMDRILQEALQQIQNHPLLHITYFEPDPYKEGGTYVHLSKSLKELDECHRMLIFTDRTRIPIDDIYELSIASSK